MSKRHKIAVTLTVIAYLTSLGFFWGGYARLQCAASAWPNRDVHISSIMLLAEIGGLFLLVASAFSGYFLGLWITKIAEALSAASRAKAAEPANVSEDQPNGAPSDS